MKYLLFFLLLLNFSCVPKPSQIRCHFKIILSDEMSDPCNNTATPFIDLNWFYGTYQLVVPKTTYRTDDFALRNNSSPFIKVRNLNQCNTITIEYYVDNVLTETKSTDLGYQSNCADLCSEGTYRTLNFIYP